MTPTAIVLLPGLDGTGILFGPLLEHLPPHLRPIVVGYPGDERMDYDALLPRVLRALPTDEPFILLGESFSGPLALLAADSRPPGLQAIVLCASFVRCPRRVPACLVEHFVQPLLFRLYTRFRMTAVLMGRHSSPEVRADFADAMAAVRPEVLAHRVRQVLRVNVAAQLLRCPVPMLYLRADRDVVVPKRNAEEIRRVLPGVTVTTINAPHMLLQTQPAQAAAAIVQFVSQVAGPS
jgi:pimeloyl-ACP methyl ester carboxylesterase